MFKKLYGLSLSLTLIIACSNPNIKDKHISISQLVENEFKSNIEGAIVYADSIEMNFNRVEYYFKQSRKFFKKAEVVFAALDANNYATLNQPNILKVREDDYTDIKRINPLGYQVLEESLFAETVDSLAVKENAEFIANRLRIVKENTRFDHLKNYHFLWMLKKEIARVAFTGITGFDSPVLENSLSDAQEVYRTIKNYFSALKHEFEDPKLLDAWLTEIDQTIRDLNADFNEFNRYTFIKDHTHKQLELYTKTVADWQVEFPFTLELNDSSMSFFSKDAFNLEKFASYKTRHINKPKIELGKKLFYDPSLSSSNKISCASCHQPSKGFSDGMKTPKGLSRNSPTLLYAGLQKGFFYDKRTGGLEGQIVDVIENKDEFHTNFKHIEKVVEQNKEYSHVYSIAYPDKQISSFYIRNAIATYVRTLAPFDSKFDRNINKLENSMTAEEIFGFNLFTGKAKCATCHFAPVFNGTIPPDYKETELELIGTPATNDTINAIISSDLGRYEVYKTEERKHFFKTPTVRNIDKTAPYMHNGVYQTLEQVIDFYNRGGGAGIGIENEFQTLPPDPLNLSNKEQQALVAFLKTLTDAKIETEY